jgi:prolyl oligopeptidase
MRIAWFAVSAAGVAGVVALGALGCGSSSTTPVSPTAPIGSAGPTTSAPAAPAPAAHRAGVPATKRQPVSDRYGEVRIVDDYRWLEDAADPGVRSWTAAQSQLTRSRLDALPDRPKIHARVAELLSNKAASYFDLKVTGSGVLVRKRQPPKQQPLLVAFSDPADPRTERVVLDPNQLDPSGATAIDFFVASRDGARIAISLSRGGSESGDLHIYDLATGRALGDVIPRVNGGTAGGSMAWNADASGFWYTRYPHDGERPTADLAFYQQVYFHPLGAPVDRDRYVLGKELPRIAEIALEASPDGKAVLATVANGDGGEFALYLIEPGASTGARALFGFGDKVSVGRFGPDGALYVISHGAAPRGRVLRIARPYTAPPVAIVPEGDAVISDLAATASRLYVVELLGGPSQMRSFRLAGGAASAPELVATPVAVSSIADPRPIGTDDVLYLTQSYTTSPGWYRYAAAAKRSTATALVQAMAFAMDDVEVVRATCASADGTAVPLNILRKRGIALDRSHPALLHGYGGYNIGLSPELHPLTRLWIDQGGIYAEANLRGGNEFGQAWHDAGRLTRKQHVFDDFYACEQALIARGYTTPERLAISGRSNGGLLMGAALVQHPEMVRAVLSGVGIYDMLRVERTPNGAFNVTEYGTVTDPEQFRALYAYSPYHHVVDRVAYPAVLLTTGANDPRVDPYNSRKMTARLQAASSSDRPILLRASDDVGHGMASPLDAVIDEATDSYAFLMDQLGMHYRD